MAVLCYKIICLVILWSLSSPAVVSGQCTVTACGAGSEYADRSESGSERESSDGKEIEILKLHLQRITDKLGML